MNYNDGKVHVEFYDKPEEYEMIAEQFSKGNPLLKETLLVLWKNGIKTIASTNGDENENPFIMFQMTRNNTRLVEALCIFMNVSEDTDISFSRLKETDDILACNVTTTLNDRDMMLNVFKTYADKKSDYIDKESKYAMDLYLFSVLNDIGFNYNISKNKKTLNLFHYQNDKPTVYIGEPTVNLSEVNEGLLKYHRIIYSAYQCDDESLDDFLSIMKNGKIESNNTQK